MHRLLVISLIFFPSWTFAVSEGVSAPVFLLPVLQHQPLRSGLEKISQPQTHKSVVESSELEHYSLASSLGKVVYLDFWASWCAPCRVSFPEIIALQSQYGDEQLEVIAVNIDEDPKAAVRFLRRFKVNYKILSDPEGRVASQFELPGMPTSFVIDQQGAVTLRHIGFKPGDMKSIQAHIESLLVIDDSTYGAETNQGADTPMAKVSLRANE